MLIVFLLTGSILLSNLCERFSLTGSLSQISVMCFTVFGQLLRSFEPRTFTAEVNEPLRC